ncbi:Kelch repeat-containing protein [Neolewinella maritima]|uniref:Kelch repeat-containing protein n=1 Tax=Neolewinella maritima TaxID=1383882 RepID=UPI001EE96881|nr:kelch repeat-containing protein [Neolewinella maritima]
MSAIIVFPFTGYGQTSAAGDFPRWTNIGAATYPRAEGQLVTYRGKYYLFNGFTTGTRFLERDEEYDPATNTYRTISPIPRRADGSFGGYTHTGVALVDDTVWLLGGRSGNPGYRTTNEVWIYDIPRDRWQPGPPLPARRGGGGLARLGRKLHYVGGFDERAACDVADHWVYDLDRPDLGWQDYSGTSPMPEARNHFGAVTLGGKLFTIAGQHGHQGCEKGKNLRVVHAYDPHTDSWERLADFPYVQSHIEPSTFAYNGKIYSLGGQGAESAKVAEYDPATNTWRTLPEYTLPLRLIAPGARVFEGNLVVVTGGEVAVNQARATTRVRNFLPNRNRRLVFHPARLPVDGRVRSTTEVILANHSAEEEVVYTVQTDDLPPWLSVDHKTGRARESFAELGISVDPSGLTPGSYRYTLRATAIGYAQAKLEVSFTVGRDGTTTNPYRAFREAECATVGGNWVLKKQADASAGAAVHIRPGLNSTAGAPAPTAANLVTFDFDLPRADHYQFFSRIKAPTTADDSFYYRFNGGSWVRWSSGLTTYGNGFDWRRAPTGPSYLPAGRATLDIAYREDGLELDKILLSSTSHFPSDLGGVDASCNRPRPSPDGCHTVWLEAECTDQPAGWYQRSHSGSSGDGYVAYFGNHQFTAPAANNPSHALRYWVTLDRAGAYPLYFRLDAIDNGKNSFWVRVDNGPWIKFWKLPNGQNLLTKGFEWVRVNDDGRALDLQLSAGAHTITVANREAGTRLDKIYLSASGPPPSGGGGLATNCSAETQSALSQQTAASGPATQANALAVYPNPALNEISFTLQDEGEGSLTLDLVDLNGSRVQRRDYRKEGEVLTGRLEVSGLPAGVYLLKLRGAEGHWHRTVVIAR